MGWYGFRGESGHGTWVASLCVGLGCAYLAWFGYCGGFGVTFEVGDIFLFGSWDLDLDLDLYIEYLILFILDSFREKYIFGLVYNILSSLRTNWAGIP